MAAIAGADVGNFDVGGSGVEYQRVGELHRAIALGEQRQGKERTKTGRSAGHH